MELKAKGPTVVEPDPLLSLKAKLRVCVDERLKLQAMLDRCSLDLEAARQAQLAGLIQDVDDWPVQASTGDGFVWVAGTVHQGERAAALYHLRVEQQRADNPIRNDHMFRLTITANDGKVALMQWLESDSPAARQLGSARRVFSKVYKVRPMDFTTLAREATGLHFKLTRVETRVGVPWN